MDALLSLTVVADVVVIENYILARRGVRSTLNQWFSLGFKS